MNTFIALYTPVDGDMADFQGRVSFAIVSANFFDALNTALSHEAGFKSIGFRLSSIGCVDLESD